MRADGKQHLLLSSLHRFYLNFQLILVE